MLACRAISRPATTLRLKFQFPRRPIHYSIPRLQIPLRPNEIWKKIRFRKDGQPRSRIVGVAFGAFHLLFLFRWLTSKHEASVIALWAWTAYTLYNSIDEGETALNLLGAVIYIQKADTGFNKVDLNDPIATLKHFKALYQGLTRFPRDEVEVLFKDITQLLKPGADQNTELEAHRIMRDAAEKIHAILDDLKQEPQSLNDAIQCILFTMKEALEGLVELLGDVEDDDSDTKYTFQLIRDHSKKDSESGVKDYESLG